MNIAKQLRKKIKRYEYIIIAKHKNPDWDAQGSALGLAWIIHDSFKDKKIFVVGERLNEDSNFSEEGLTKEMIKDALLITVDTAAKRLIDFDHVSKVDAIFKVDHHLNNDPFGDWNLVDETAIANTQVITLWAEEQGLVISEQAASNLYKGLITDSGRFLYQRTGTKTYEAASILVSTGINIEAIYQDLYLNPLKVKRWQNQAFKKMKLTKKGVAYIVVGPTDYEKFGLTKSQIKTGLFTMNGIEEVKIWAFICQYDTGEIRVSLRSREYDVNAVAKQYDGGGHRLASGAKLKKLTEVPKLIKDLETLMD